MNAVPRQPRPGQLAEDHIPSQVAVYDAASSPSLLTNCDGCGACCRHMIVPPFRDRNEPRSKHVPDTLITELLPLWEVRLHLPEQPCLWFDSESARCRHYELRPDACREFEINSPSCLACREKWNVPWDTAVVPNEQPAERRHPPDDDCLS